MILNVSARSGENCILVPYNWKTACECQLREKLCWCQMRGKQHFSAR